MNDTGDKQKNKPNPYVKYSSMGLQMVIIVGLGAFAGVKIDEYFQVAKFPVFTVCLSLFSIFAAIYLFMKEALKK